MLDVHGRLQVRIDSQQQLTIGLEVIAILCQDRNLEILGNPGCCSVLSFRGVVAQNLGDKSANCLQLCEVERTWSCAVLCKSSMSAPSPGPN